MTDTNHGPAPEPYSFCEKHFKMNCPECGPTGALKAQPNPPAAPELEESGPRFVVAPAEAPRPTFSAPKPSVTDPKAQAVLKASQEYAKAREQYAILDAEIKVLSLKIEQKREDLLSLEAARNKAKQDLATAMEEA